MSEVTNTVYLTRLTKAAHALAEIKTPTDAARLIRYAEAARVYARQAELGTDAENAATAIRLKAELRLAEIVSAGQKAKQIAAKGRRNVQDENISTLADLGVSRFRLSEARTLAAKFTAAKIDKLIDAANEKRQTLSRHGLLRALRVERDEAAAARVKPMVPADHPTCDIRHGDFRTVLADVPARSVDVVLTDPPYPAEYLPLWSDLATFAKRVLKPDGMLVAMSGQTHLPEVMARLGAHLPYRWVIAYEITGAAAVVHARRVQSMWKPVLVYGASTRRIFDLARSENADKAHHEWGQSESGMDALLRLVADPGQTICDPFLGGGTTGVVALSYGCPFIGAELEREAFDHARKRLAA